LCGTISRHFSKTAETVPNMALAIPPISSKRFAVSCLAEFWNRGRQSRTKYIIRNAPERVTITRRHHPLQGQSFEVLMEGKQHLTVALSDGTSMRILRQWTNADGIDASDAREGIYTTESLRRLLLLVDALQSR